MRPALYFNGADASKVKTASKYATPETNEGNNSFTVTITVAR